MQIARPYRDLLNEVLSITAQELAKAVAERTVIVEILNEVLSITAQESRCSAGTTT